MGYPRDAVADMLLPVFLPFNLLKGGLNAAFTMMLYKPVVSALRAARLVPESDLAQPSNRRVTISRCADVAVGGDHLHHAGAGFKGSPLGVNQTKKAGRTAVCAPLFFAQFGTLL